MTAPVQPFDLCACLRSGTCNPQFTVYLRHFNPEVTVCSAPGPASAHSARPSASSAAGALITLGGAPYAVADGSKTGLVLEAIAPINGVKPGSTFEAPVTFGTTGTETLEKIWLSYYVTQGLDFADIPSNCVRWEIGSYDELPPRSLMTCEFDQAVEPGVVYAPEKLTLKALDRALYDDLDVTVMSYSHGPDEQAHGPVRGTAPAAKLVERPDSVLTGSNSGNPGYAKARVRVNAANTADFQVSGAELKGRVGDTVDVKVKFTNSQAPRGC